MIHIWRNIMRILEVSHNGISLSLSKGFIRISSEDSREEHPLDLVDCILLNSYGAKISNQLMIKLCEMGIPLIICGNNSVPIGILNPSSQNVHRKTRVQLQLSTSSAFKNRIWQTIIKAKLNNQAMLLKQLNLPHNDIVFLKNKVRSGDLENCEAMAARFYWQRLFGDSFRRNPEWDGPNSFLNYAYAILRASFCRQICASGLLPEYGVHHKNKMNPFCLADDLIEPFRPFADKVVFELINSGSKSLNSKDKKTIIYRMDCIIPYKKKNQHLQNCISIFVQDLVKTYEEKRIQLEFPKLPDKWVQDDVDDGDV